MPADSTTARRVAKSGALTAMSFLPLLRPCCMSDTVSLHARPGQLRAAQAPGLQGSALLAQRGERKGHQAACPCPQTL